MTCSSHTNSRWDCDRASLLLGLCGAVYGHQRRQRIGDLDAREALVAVGVADQRGQVQAEVGDVRERPPRIEGQRGQNGKRRFGEVIRGHAQLDFVQLGVIEDSNSALGPSRGEGGPRHL